MIILIGNQKGGVGKSTIACNISGMLVNRGHDIILVDSDEQKTTSMWVEDRRAEQPTMVKINSVQKFGDVDDALEDLNKRYEYVIVDAAGRDSRELRSALLVCDIIAMPFRSSAPDLKVLPLMEQMVRNSRRVNNKLRAFAFINSAPTNTQGKDAFFARQAISECNEIKLFEITIHDRRVFRDGMSEGLAVIEMNDDSSSAKLAKEEMENLLVEILNDEAV
ncbi:MAG: division plane positioning ATPase MipZ [Methylobacter sp.]|nr:division plane positioning ATPase MipZ [Methylobacter sp.]MDP3056560.1 division plane positioning ATPase MipZ [Methylobacter sp.]MDP3364186.1 division plane positioning ATPase MipZ [Methylobacter sp.]MDZ4217956.1 division plane positioning ATPase MipZ [Methylobacter sp.]